MRCPFTTERIDLVEYQGTSSLINLLVQVGFIFITLWGLKTLNLERAFRRPPQSLPLVLVLVAVAVGSGCANFFIGFFTVLRGALGMLN